jgi:hypothetical protein
MNNNSIKDNKKDSEIRRERLNPKDAILKSYYGSKFCCGCKEENCICDSPNSENK